MKTPFITKILYLLVLTSPLLVKAEKNSGIQFFEGSWKALLQLAQQENKPIFVDVYTDWCPPCKRMDKEVLPLPEVGNAYNGSFINYKLDAEKGEGKAISKQYEVQAYPTYLYLTPEGVLLARVVDYQEAPRFIALANEALKKNGKQVLAGMEKQFKEGKRDLPFLEEYIQQKNAVGLDNSEVFNAYFAAKPVTELRNPATIDFMGNYVNSPKGVAFAYLLKAYPSLDKNTQQKLAPSLYRLLTNSFAYGMEENRLLEVQQAFSQMDMLKKQLNPNQLAHINLYKLRYAQKVKDAAMAKKAGYAYVGTRMDLSLDTIQAEDKKRYLELMQPYLSGEIDSTQIENFTLEKEEFRRTYTGEISVHLYEAATTFDAVLDDQDPALLDALQWTEQLIRFYPDREVMAKLKDRLTKKTNQIIKQ